MKVVIGLIVYSCQELTFASSRNLDFRWGCCMAVVFLFDSLHATPMLLQYSGTRRGHT